MLFVCCDYASVSNHVISLQDVNLLIIFLCKSVKRHSRTFFGSSRMQKKCINIVIVFY